MHESKAFKNNYADFIVESFKNVLALNPDFQKIQYQDVDIPLGQLSYSCRLKPQPEAQFLCVQLNGALPRGEGTSLPVFARWNWGENLCAHILSICDPTLYLDETIAVGWYLGTEKENALHGLLAIAQRCAELLGLSDEQIVFSGSAGGGFAALQAAALMKNGRALAINAQTDLLKYNINHVNSYVDKVSGCSSREEAEKGFGARWNAITALQAAMEQGRAPKVVFVQNRNDAHHYQAHFSPFAAAFGLDLMSEQAKQGNFMSLLYDGPHAHTQEPPDVVERYKSEGIPFLLNR